MNVTGRIRACVATGDAMKYSCRYPVKSITAISKCINNKTPCGCRGLNYVKRNYHLSTSSLPVLLLVAGAGAGAGSAAGADAAGASAS